MARKTISLTGELHMNSTGFSVTVDALETLKIVGIAYGVYDHAEDLRDCRVTMENGERPAISGAGCTGRCQLTWESLLGNCAYNYR